MKIYLFNSETGVYLGEDFADEAPMKRGAFIVPPDATTIVPPSTERCKMLVFNAEEQRWDFRQRPVNNGWMVIKKHSLSLFLVALLFLPVTLHAVTYPFPENEPAFLKDETVMKVGTKLYLFHSGTEDVKNSIHVHDSLAVYRVHPDGHTEESKEVGKVRVLSPLGDYYFNGEVIGGEVKAGDLAKKGAIACYISSFKVNGHQQ